MKKIIAGITGASGSILAHGLIEALLQQNHEVHLVVTAHGRQVLAHELERDLMDLVQGYRKSDGRILLHDDADLFAPVASGSFRADAMIILPCSMGTLAKVANGISDSLLTRAADVMLKEQRRLLLVPRETPLSAIHLENMLKLSRLGVVIMPPVPAFYHKPETMADSNNLTIGRVLETLGIENPYHRVWGMQNE